jgi:hypothetical protein
MATVDADRAWSEQALRALLDEWDDVRLRVTGDCMAPRLCDGDVVALRSTRRGCPRWGDVVLVRTPAGLRLHRVIWRGRGGASWRTKGDHAPFSDGVIALDDILAVAPKKRHLAAALVSLLGLVAAGSLARVIRAVRP